MDYIENNGNVVSASRLHKELVPRNGIDANVRAATKPTVFESSEDDARKRTILIRQH